MCVGWILKPSRVNHSKWRRQEDTASGQEDFKQIRRVHFILEDQISMHVQELTSPAVLWGRESAFQRVSLFQSVP